MTVAPRTILITLDASTADLPDAITAAAEQYDRVAVGLAALGGSNGTVPFHTLAALDAGRDPFTDPKVQQAAAADHFVSIGGHTQVEALAAERFREALRLQASDLIASMQTVADRAAASITRAHKTLGNVDPADPNAVLRLGGKAAEAWGQHQSAAKQLDAINTARGVIAQALRWSEPSKHVRALRWARLDLEQIEQHGSVAPEVLVRAGIQLVLADGAELQRRLQHIAAQQQAEVDAQERRARQSMRSLPVSI